MLRQLDQLIGGQRSARHIELRERVGPIPDKDPVELIGAQAPRAKIQRLNKPQRGDVLAAHHALDPRPRHHAMH
ncbi:hypothetical protein, partial [Brevundimonas sp.]|uniref:hypothetical protein n=1 Tax=Brevundimonas sp. TaxID=1871086 RepID=UPI0034217C65